MELAADCPDGAIDAPLLADATQVVTLRSLVSYVTGATPAEVAAFYQHELADLGWQPSTDATVSDAATVQGFTRDDESLTLVITPGEGGTMVRLGGG